MADKPILACLAIPLLSKSLALHQPSIKTVTTYEFRVSGLLVAPATKLAQLSNAPAAKVARVIQAYASKAPSESAAA